MATAYLLTNMTGTFIGGQPLYSWMTWDGLISASVIPIGVLGGCVLDLLGWEWLTNKKLSKLGYTEILDVIQGKNIHEAP